MTDPVQQLIDRIRKDAVETAREEAKAIQQRASDEAQRRLATADQQARALVAAAEQQSSALLARGGKALEQAARDLLVAIGQRLQTMVEALLVDAAAAALRPDVVEQMLLVLCAGLARTGLDEQNVAIAVGPGERDQIARFALGRLREHLQQGVEVHVDQQLQQGFRLSFAHDTVRHDFTPAAIAAALAQFVRPQLAAVVLRAAGTAGGGADGKGRP